jgi:hypothetical protein
MDIIRILAETRGFFTRAEALDAGGKDQDLTGAVRSRLLVRFRRGYYTYARHRFITSSRSNGCSHGQSAMRTSNNPLNMMNRNYAKAWQGGGQTKIVA